MFVKLRLQASITFRLEHSPTPLARSICPWNSRMSRLDSFLDDLNAENLRAALRDPYIGNRIVVVQETTSTNDLVWQMAQEKVADGLVAFAERQTAGRGQRGNRWESAPHHGLWFSILLRPKIGPAQSARLST